MTTRTANPEDQQHGRPPATSRRRRRRGIGVGVASIALVVGGYGAGSAQAAPSSQDTQWMVAAHQSNLAEISAGNSSQSRAATAEVRRLGAMFVQMHTDMDTELSAAAAQLGVQLPATPSPAQQQALAAVEANSGSAYDAAWLTQQRAGHQQALDATKTETSAGSDPTVVALATAAVPVIQSHLDEVVAALADAGAPTRVETGSGGQAARQARSWAVPITLAVLGVAMIGLAGSLAWPRRRRS
jgi:putative membrane protein